MKNLIQLDELHCLKCTITRVCLLQFRLFTTIVQLTAEAVRAQYVRECVFCLCVSAFFLFSCCSLFIPLSAKLRSCFAIFFSLWSDYCFSPPSAKWFSSTHIFFQKVIETNPNTEKDAVNEHKIGSPWQIFLCCSRWAKQCMSLSVYLCVFLCHFSNFFCL